MDLFPKVDDAWMDLGDAGTSIIMHKNEDKVSRTFTSLPFHSSSLFSCPFRCPFLCPSPSLALVPSFFCTFDVLLRLEREKPED